jgi:hypothetical protein
MALLGRKFLGKGNFVSEMAGAGEVHVSASRYGLLLTQGSLYNTGLQLSNVAAVLPFICAEQGIFWAAGLLYPAYSTGTIIGNSISPHIIRRSRHLKHLVVATTAATMAALIVSNAVAALTGILVAVVFLLTSWASGVVNGLLKVAYSEVLSSKLPETHRNDVILRGGAVGAVVAILATPFVVPILAGQDPAARHVDLLWLGAMGMVAAAIAAVFIGPVSSASKTVSRRMRDTYREGMNAARSQRWFRTYAATQLIFVPVGLGMTFYSLHASRTQ